MTVKELRKQLEGIDGDLIVTIERPDEPEDRHNDRYLETGPTENDPADEYFVIYSD